MCIEFAAKTVLFCMEAGLNYLVLFFQDFGRVVLLVRHVNTLQAVNVSGQSCFVYMRLASLNDLNQGVVNEDILLFSLHQMSSLSPDVLQVTENVDVTPGLYLS